MSLINGNFNESIDILDRGFQYGDGVFETIEVLNGKPLFLDRHLSRLEKGCKNLLIPAPDVAKLTDEALQLSADVSHAVLKLIVTRGTGGRGYRQPSPITPTRVLTLFPFPDLPEYFSTQGISTRFCHHRLASNPPLAKIKHLNRLDQIIARAEWQDESIQEGIMLDYQGQVIEGTMSNLFMVKDSVIYTPILSDCGVAGIVREIIIEIIKQQMLQFYEQKIGMATLLTADEIFLTNSIIGIWPVKQLQEFKYGIGAMTRNLQEKYQAIRLDRKK